MELNALSSENEQGVSDLKLEHKREMRDLKRKLKHDCEDELDELRSDKAVASAPESLRRRRSRSPSPQLFTSALPTPVQEYMQEEPAISVYRQRLGYPPETVAVNWFSGTDSGAYSTYSN